MANAKAIAETLRAFYDVTEPNESETTASIYFTVAPKGSILDGMIAVWGRPAARQIRLSDHFNGRGVSDHLSRRLTSAEIIRRIHILMEAE